MQKKILIYGYGNPGRQDDGLGPALAEKVNKLAEKSKLKHIKTDSNYQLNIEDAAEIKDRDIVIFADASIEEIDSYILTKVDPKIKAEFTMHAASPAFILGLCHKLYQKYPATYLLHIKGYEWEFKEGLSKKGEDNLEKAFKFVKGLLGDVESIESFLGNNQKKD